MTPNAWLRVAIALALSGCASAPSRPTPAPRAETPAVHAAGARTPLAPLPFIEDDYAKALAEARAKHRLLFIDAWAAWCHTCMSMRSFVFTDDALKAKADAFVWLSIDSERPENEAFLKRFPIDALPTLWVIEPANEAPTLKWVGSLTATELVALLDGAATTKEAAGALALGNQAAAKGDTAKAIAAFREAVKESPVGSTRRATAVDMLVAQLAEAKDEASCAALASEEVATLSRGTSSLNVAVAGTGCAVALPKNAASRAKELDALVGELRKQLVDPALPVLADDRSSAFEELVFALKSAGDAAEAKKMSAAWASFLEGEARKAPNAAARAVFDPHRLNAYLELGEAERALPMLAESERDFPLDYNPPARIARADFELKRYPEALAAAARARQKAYGPRKLRIYLLTADILAAQGDRGGEGELLREALAYAKTIPLREGYEKLRDNLEKRLQGLGASRATGAPHPAR